MSATISLVAHLHNSVQSYVDRNDDVRKLIYSLTTSFKVVSAKEVPFGAGHASYAASDAAIAAASAKLYPVICQLWLDAITEAHNDGTE